MYGGTFRYIFKLNRKSTSRVTAASLAVAMETILWESNDVHIRGIKLCNDYEII